MLDQIRWNLATGRARELHALVPEVALLLIGEWNSKLMKHSMRRLRNVS